MIYGYKCFNEGLVDRYGVKFEKEKVYHTNNDIKFNNNGFHFCTNLEDTLRYFDAMNSTVDIAYVIGYGDTNKYDDEYNGFYDMYATEYLQIVYVLSREDVIKYALKLSPERVKRFISLYRLNSDEIKLFEEKYYNIPSVLDAISYYQLGDTKVYKKRI